ncbi:hypothetical protein BG22_05815 [Bifidobacterium sp. UTBIF-78]|nr:hypothetical protein BG22_05815 [Bifidobacterium sp. UTBIF-78]
MPEAQPSGLFIIDKPQGVTSFDAVAAVRGALHIKKVGHAGTLDPMATGALVIAFGHATRLLNAIVEHDKTYEATIRLGLATTTDDAEGDVILRENADAVASRWRQLAAGGAAQSDAAESGAAEPGTAGDDGTDTACEADFGAGFGIDSRAGSRGSTAAVVALGTTPATDDASVHDGVWHDLLTRTIGEHFTGDIEQVPNTFSAIKINGQRAYDLAREGKDVELKARPVTISEFTVLGVRAGVVAGTRPDEPLQERDIAGFPSAQPHPSGWPGWSGSVRSANHIGDCTCTDGRSDGCPPASGLADPASSSGSDSATAEATASNVIPISVLDVDVRVSCSSGTYIRALARDLGEELGVGGYLTRLRRTRVGRFALPDDTSGLITPESLAETRTHTVTAHVETKTFTNREGQAVTRNKCVLDTPDAMAGEKRREWLLGRALTMEQAARGAMPVVEITAEEATELRFGRRIERVLAKGTQAVAIVPPVHSPAHSPAHDEPAVESCDATDTGTNMNNDALHGRAAEPVSAEPHGDAVHPSGVANAPRCATADVVAIIERANAHQAKPAAVFPAA